MSILKSFWRRGAYGKCAILAVIGVLLYSLIRPKFEGDTEVLLRNADAALACLRDGQFTRCEGAYQWPLFQMAPAVLLRALGASHRLILWIFSMASLAAFLGSIGILWGTLRSRGLVASWIALLVYLSGYNLFYLNSSFTEGAAAFFFLVLASAALEPRASLGRFTFPALFLACLSKETAPPFAFLILCLALIQQRSDRASHVQVLKKLGLGLAVTGLSVCFHIGFNWFKFGTLTNQVYLDPKSIVHSWTQQLDFAVALWFSPSGGLAFFWPSFFLLLLGLGWLVFHGTRQKLTYFGVILLLAIQTAGLSRWWAPFGWIAWGPRLSLPLLPACLVLLLHAYGPLLENSFGKLALNRRRWRIGAIALGITAFPHFAILVRRNFIGHIFDNGCTSGYNECLSQILWHQGFPLLSIYSPWPRPEAFICGALYAVFLYLIADQLRVKLSPSGQ